MGTAVKERDGDSKTCDQPIPTKARSLERKKKKQRKQ